MYDDENLKKSKFPTFGLLLTKNIDFYMFKR